MFAGSSEDGVTAPISQSCEDSLLDVATSMMLDFGDFAVHHAEFGRDSSCPGDIFDLLRVLGVGIIVVAVCAANIVSSS